MRRHLLQHRPFPAVVLHELRGQLDGIPLDAVDAGYSQLADLRQHVVQAMAGLVEQGRHLVVRERCRLVANRREKLQMR